MYWVPEAAFLSWFKVLIFIHPHKSKRFCFKAEMGIPAISDIQVFVPKIRLHQEYEEEEEEEEEREQRKDKYGRKAIFTTRMSIDL